MVEPFLSEICLFPFGFVPRGWAACNGQLLSINQNQALFSLLGTTYGGDGRVNFALPDLRGRVIVHSSNAFVLGERGGERSHTLLQREMPRHTHALKGLPVPATGSVPSGGDALAQRNSEIYGPATRLTPMGPAAIGPQGGGQPHENMQPHLALNYCIALVGIYPSRN